MRSPTKLCLAAATVASIAALLGVSSASAAALHPFIGMCSVPELLLCAAANKIARASGGLLAKQIGTGKFEGGLFTQECTGAEAAATVGEQEEGKLPVSITSFTFTGCSPCTTVTINGLPLAGTVTMTEEGEAGEWKLKASGSATFSGCPFGAKCKFGGEIVARLEMTATESIINTNNSKLTLQEGSEFLCGASGLWKAKFAKIWDLTAPPQMKHTVWTTLLATP